MKKEYSYGAVVYKKENGKLLVLIEHMKLGHISIPKGHIEKGETPLTCTLREIREETNLIVEVDQGFSHTITYCPNPCVSKDVTFYVAKPISGDLKPQPEEVSSLEWVEVQDAIRLVTFETDKTTLSKAKEYLEKNA
ncbi:MAG: NUDIX domain-containing protein [Bacilli bacterium]|jgi:8-oxo-dGTP pyrophosphatase MutT (NUDIX family)